MCSGWDSYPTCICWGEFDWCPSLKTHNLHNTVMEFSVFSACLRWQHSSGSEDDVILKKCNFVIIIKSKTCAMSTTFKMADFLLGFGHCNWLFCRSACHTHVYQMSLMHVKLATTAALWGGASRPFVPPFGKTLYIFTTYDACAKLHEFLWTFTLRKKLFTWAKEGKTEIIPCISRGSSHGLCLGSDYQLIYVEVMNDR